VTDAVRHFQQAEQRVFARYGVAVTTRLLELREPPLRVRVLECGEGRPVVLVGGDSAVAAAWAPLLAQLPGTASDRARPPQLRPRRRL